MCLPSLGQGFIGRKEFRRALKEMELDFSKDVVQSIGYESFSSSIIGDSDIFFLSLPFCLIACTVDRSPEQKWR